MSTADKENRASTAGELDQRFTAVLRKSPDKGRLDLCRMTEVRLPAVRRAIGKEEGDTVTVRPQERLSP